MSQQGHIQDPEITLPAGSQGGPGKARLSLWEIVPQRRHCRNQHSPAVLMASDPSQATPPPTIIPSYLWKQALRLDCGGWTTSKQSSWVLANTELQMAMNKCRGKKPGPSWSQKYLTRVGLTKEFLVSYTMAHSGPANFDCLWLGKANFDRPGESHIWTGKSQK